MGFFGPSRKERFIRNNPLSLANYLKDNSVMAGGKAYARCVASEILPEELNKELLWYFWNIIFAFRISVDTIKLRNDVNEDAIKALWAGFIQIDKKYFKSEEHKLYPNTFKNVGLATNIVHDNSNMDTLNCAIVYANKVAILIDDVDHDNKEKLCFEIALACDSFPSLKSIVDNNM